MKWKKPSGLIIETNEDQVTVDKCIELEWEPLEDDGSEVVIEDMPEHSDDTPGDPPEEEEAV